MSPGAIMFKGLDIAYHNITLQVVKNTSKRLDVACYLNILQEVLNTSERSYTSERCKFTSEGLGVAYSEPRSLVLRLLAHLMPIALFAYCFRRILICVAKPCCSVVISFAAAWACDSKAEQVVTVVGHV